MSSKNGKQPPPPPKTYPIPPATKARIARLVTERDAARRAAEAAAGQLGAILQTMTEIMGLPFGANYQVDLYDLDRGLFPAAGEPTPDPTATRAAEEESAPPAAETEAFAPEPAPV